MRHPSTLTKGEFIEIAKLVNWRPFSSMALPKRWKMKLHEDASLPDTYHLSSQNSSYAFWFSWEDYESMGVCISFDDGEQEIYPSFQDSLKIAEYLDKIGIQYKPQTK